MVPTHPPTSPLPEPSITELLIIRNLTSEYNYEFGDAKLAVLWYQKDLITEQLADGQDDMALIANAVHNDEQTRKGLA